MAQNDQTIEKLEPDGRYNDEIHRCNAIAMVLKEGLPRLTTRIATTPHHVLGDCGLRNPIAEQQQLTMDPRRTPKRVLLADLVDQIA